MASVYNRLLDKLDAEHDGLEKKVAEKTQGLMVTVGDAAINRDIV